MNIALDGRRKAIIWMVTNCFFGTLVNVFVKLLTKELSVPAIMVGYNLGCLIIISILLFFSGISIKTNKLHLHFCRAILSSIAFLLYFMALKTTAIANAVAITFIDPMLTCAFAYLLLKETIEKDNIFALIMGLVGALLIIKPGSDLFQINSLIILFSTIFWSISNISMKLLTKTEHSLVQIFYMCLFTVITTSIVCYCGNYEVIIPSNRGLMLLAIISVVALMQYFAIYQAFSNGKMSEIMPFFFMNIIFCEFFGYFWFGETHDKFEAIGVLIIICTNIYLLYRAKQLRKQQSNSTPKL